MRNATHRNGQAETMAQLLAVTTYDSALKPVQTFIFGARDK